MQQKVSFKVHYAFKSRVYQTLAEKPPEDCPENILPPVDLNFNEPEMRK